MLKEIHTIDQGNSVYLQKYTKLTKAAQMALAVSEENF